MQLHSDIQINEYSATKKKINEKEQKNLLLSFSVFQDEIESAIIDTDNNTVYTSCIYSSSQRKFTNHEMLFLINDFIYRYHLQQINFKKIRVIFSSPHFTFCPDEFYLPDKKSILLSHAHPSQVSETVLTNDFETIKIIYSISTNIYHNLLQIFPSANFFHSSTVMMNIMFYHPYLIHSKIWVHIHPNYIEIIAKDNKKFLFYNSFDTQNSVDILYYILFCMEQLNFNPTQTDLFLSGNISTQYTVFQLLQKYVHSVQLVHHHPKLHILPVNTQLISHHHFITLNHYLCASFPENTKAEK